MENFVKLEHIVEITEPLALKDSGDIGRFNTARERNLKDTRDLAVNLNEKFIPTLNRVTEKINEQLPYIRTVADADVQIRANADNLPQINTNATHMDQVLAVNVRLPEIRTTAANLPAIIAAPTYAQQARVEAERAEDAANRAEDIVDIGPASTEKAGIVRLNDSLTSTSTTEAATPNAVRKVMDEIEDVRQEGQLGSVAIGAIVAWPMDTPEPEGCLFCNGGVVKKTEYATLYAVIGDKYSLGDEAVDEFRLPFKPVEFMRKWVRASSSLIWGYAGAQTDIIILDMSSQELCHVYGGMNSNLGRAYLYIQKYNMAYTGYYPRNDMVALYSSTGAPGCTSAGIDSVSKTLYLCDDYVNILALRRGESTFVNIPRNQNALSNSFIVVDKSFVYNYCERYSQPITRTFLMYDGTSWLTTPSKINGVDGKLGSTNVHKVKIAPNTGDAWIYVTIENAEYPGISLLRLKRGAESWDFVSSVLTSAYDIFICNRCIYVYQNKDTEDALLRVSTSDITDQKTTVVSKKNRILFIDDEENL